MTPLQFTLHSPIELLALCRTSASTVNKHPITVNPDWSFQTPHDLEAEAVAAAMGGVCTCLELPQAIAAARHFVELNVRATRGRIRPFEDAWRISSRCIPRRRPYPGAKQFPTATAAAAHVRSHPYIAEQHGVRPWQFTPIVDALPWTSDPRLPSSTELLASHRRLTGEGALSELWEAGIAPAKVDEIAPWDPYTRLTPEQAMLLVYTDLFDTELAELWEVTGSAAAATTLLRRGTNYVRGLLRPDEVWR